MLLIACANLANLLVARALTREKELAVRAAIGANRDRLARQMITESAGLAAVGGALGVAIALAAIPLLSKLVPNTMPVADVPGLDLRMLAVAGLITLGTPGPGSDSSLASGLAAPSRPACFGMAPAPATRRSTERVRSTLVIVEVMASVVLLVASGNSRPRNVAGPGDRSGVPIDQHPDSAVRLDRCRGTARRRDGSSSTTA